MNNTDVLQHISYLQGNSGQFPTTMINSNTGDTRLVHTICPTYLTTLALMKYREGNDSSKLLDTIIEKGGKFLEKMAYRDTFTGMWVWHFNSFYQPDSEETAACALILNELGYLRKAQLKPLREHFLKSETFQGIAVWMTDNYSPGNANRNAVHDPVVSMMVLTFFKTVFNEAPDRTGEFVHNSLQSDLSSYYYNDPLRLLIAELLGFRASKDSALNAKDVLFHHQSRPEVGYASEVVNHAFALT